MELWRKEGWRRKSSMGGSERKETHGGCRDNDDQMTKYYCLCGRIESYDDLAFLY
jgi:hypothetical protein